ncbi:MAG: L-2-amino-thiazoline-4-carboxylic acid hydrolase [Synergistaceae bacterium]|nr:L-2-amino-thiazoline-4-carboxylic acid hydrolase [Synergistaceae bacterium]
MFTVKEMNVINLQDSYTLFYGILGGHVIERLGLKGESALREGVRRFGRDRGTKRREAQLAANYKINMKNLFSVGSDLPSDPRFGRDRLALIPQERISHTLACPMADVWRAHNLRAVGRLYCEEFHPACYSAYAYGYTRVNLGRTLTQDGDEYCSFNIILRPEHLPENLRPVCFEEYDPHYTGPSASLPKAEAKSGFGSLCIRIYHYIFEVLLERFGEEGRAVAAGGLEKAAEDAVRRLKEQGEAMQSPVNRDFVEANMPLRLSPDSDPLWSGYDTHGALDLMKKHFYAPVTEALGL